MAFLSFYLLDSPLFAASATEMERSQHRKEKTEDALTSYKNQYESKCKWIGRVDKKHAMSAPYHFFLTAVSHVPATYEETLSITFPELLDPSLGQIEHSLHVNFMVDLSWLLAQYAVNGLVNPPMTILYDADDDTLSHLPSHLRVTAVMVKSPFAFGHHHTKLSVFFYSDKSLRFAVYTANLIESDWEDRTQGVYLSPKCPYLGDSTPINYGESETLFKVDVLRYLNSYHLPELRDCLLRIQKSDCSSIRVCFVASIPGDHDDDFGYRKLGRLIQEHSSADKMLSELVFQCSSIGSLGPSPDSWLLGEFARDLSGSTTETKVSVIYPSFGNVKRSIHGLHGGGCLPYSGTTHEKQTWLNRYLRQWTSEIRFRSQAVPHIKTYAGVRPTDNKVSWFLLTSANLSKAAWGKQKKSGRVQIMSYEAGVLFLPRFLVGDDLFEIRRAGDDDDKRFPLPYDWPLKPYMSTDGIFLYDRHFPR